MVDPGGIRKPRGVYGTESPRRSAESVKKRCVIWYHQQLILATSPAPPGMEKTKETRKGDGKTDQLDKGELIVEELLEECLRDVYSETEWDIAKRARLLEQGGRRELTTRGFAPRNYFKVL